MNSINKEDKILSVIKMQHKQSEMNFIDQNCNKPSLKLNNNELLKIRSSNKNIILHFRDLAKDLLPLLSIEDIILITDSQLVLIDSIIRDDKKKVYSLKLVLYLALIAWEQMPYHLPEN